MEDWAMDALALARDYTLDNLETVGDFARFPRPTCRWSREADGALDLYRRHLRALDRRHG
jgi:NAD-reducing hydrogenase large subunit